MDLKMLIATQQSAIAAQSAADAAWWALAPNFLAAIGTVGALAVAIWLGVQGIFDARRRDRAFLVAVAAMLDEMASTLLNVRRWRQDGWSNGRLRNSVLGPLRDLGTLEGIRKVETTRFPNEQSLVRFRMAVIAVHHAVHEFKESTDDQPVDLDRIDRLRGEVNAVADELYALAKSKTRTVKSNHPDAIERSAS